MSESLKIQPQLPIEDNRKFRPENFIHTSLFSEVYVFNDIPNKFKNIWGRIDDKGVFDQFFNDLISLMGSFSPEEANAWNHTQTLQNLVFPLLEALGYGDVNSKNHSFLENHLLSFVGSDGNQFDLKPSILFFEDEAGKQYIKKSERNALKSELNKYLKLAINTSYYGSSFDRKSNRYDLRKDEIGKRGDVFTSLGPNLQIKEHLKALEIGWGIYTDGAIWRLYKNDPSNSDAETYFEFDFSELYNLYRTSGENAVDEHSELFEVAKYFYWFFSYGALFKGPTVIPFVEDVFLKSQIYVENIEEDLKERFVHAMTISCNGYLASIRKKNSDENLKLIAKTSESLIFNLIFIRACESRRVLPIHQDYIHISLKALIEKIRHFSYSNAYEASAKFVKASLADVFGKIIQDDGHEIYDYILRLHETVENGHNGFGITGFTESVFYPEEKKILKKYKISNMDMIKLIYQLFYNISSGRNVQIPYNLITPRQLGSIYESFLEFQPFVTQKKLYYIKKSSGKKVSWQWVEEAKVNKAELMLNASVPKGGVIFSADNEERKSSGSYYTPDYIVDFIIQNTLDEKLSRCTVKDILDLKICDPAMGSGHFLLGVVDYLSRKIAEKDSNKTLQHIKRDVLDSCIFGVDKNPSAVKLAKMSLWLATALPGWKLEKLDDQLKVGDSLIDSDFKWEKEFKKVFDVSKGFHAIVGNPPYVDVQSLGNEYVNQLRTIYESASKGMFDLYIPFIERSHNLINSKGRVGLILPNKFLTTDYGQSLRTMFCDQKSLSSIVDFTHHQVFDNVSTYTCLLFLNKTKTSSFGYVTATPDQIKMKCIPTLDNFEIHNFNGSDKWSFTSGSEEVFWEKIKSSGAKLLDLGVKMSRGSSSGDDDIYMFNKTSNGFITSDGEHVDIEEGILRKVLKAQNFDTYKFSDSKNQKYILFPYMQGKSKFEVIEESNLKKKFPKAYKYLLKKKNLLEKRKGCKIWYAYSAARSLELHDQASILSPMVANKGKWALAGNMNRFCMMASAGFTICTEKSQINPHLLIGILNSTLMFGYLEKFSGKVRGGWSLCTKQFVGELPIKLPSNKSEELLAAKIVELVKEISKNPKNFNELHAEIDSFVFKFYGVNSEDLKMYKYKI